MKECVVLIFLSLTLFSAGFSHPFDREIKFEEKNRSKNKIINSDNPEKNFRTLPGDLKPFYYQIKIHPYFDAPGVTYNKSKDQTFDGEVTIYIGVKKPTSKIILNVDFKILTLFDFNFFEVYSISKDKLISIIALEEAFENETISLLLERELNKNEYIKLNIPYFGKIGFNTDYGFFKSISHNYETNVDDMVYATQFATTGGRAAFPCFDEPSYKAVFQMEIIKPKSWVALSNTLNISSIDVENGYESVIFDQSPFMSSYLLAFAIGDLVSSEGPNTETPITRIWSFKSGKNKLKAALDSAQKCVKVLKNYTNFPLPLKKIDHLVIPKTSIIGSNAMENFGLIIYDQTLILFETQKDDENGYNLNKWIDVTRKICHETSHQWFGNIVTNEWWGDLWIHEGVADYFENFAMTLVYPNEKEYMNYKFAMDNLEIPLIDKTYNHPIITENGNFDQITYVKGGGVIRQLAAIILPETLQKGYQNYLIKFQYSNANYKQLLDSIQDAVNSTNLKDWCGEYFNVHKFMELWLTQPGHPILEIDYSNGTYFINQKLMNNNTSEKFWPLPIFTQSLNGQKRIYWSAPNIKCINGKSIPKTLKIKSPVLFINRDELAITQLWYSESALQTIIDALLSFSDDLQLSAASIATLINDLSINAKRLGTSKEHFQSIIQNILIHQKKSFNYGIFNEITKLIENELEVGKFDNVLQRIE